MKCSDKKALTSALAPEQIVYLLETDGRFEGSFKADGFEVTEKKEWANKTFFPIITGSIRSFGDHSDVVLSFNYSKSSRISTAVFSSVIFILAVVSGILSSDVLLPAALLSFDCIINSVFYFCCAYHCRIATKIITKIISG